MIGGYAVHGHAIVSADDRIADAAGAMPPALSCEADWRRFQAALDTAVVTVLGARGHAAHPNDKGRNRLVVSSTASGVERRADGWWWNPAGAPFAEALAQAAPRPGIVAVPGGRRVFDLFLEIGFDRFDLARAAGATIPDGIALFTAIDEEGLSAEAVLSGHGLAPEPPEMLDPDAGVALTVWRRG